MVLNSEGATPMGRRRLSSLDRIDVNILATLQRHGLQQTTSWLVR
jgi:hypothetical protein